MDESELVFVKLKTNQKTLQPKNNNPLKTQIKVQQISGTALNMGETKNKKKLFKLSQKIWILISCRKHDIGFTKKWDKVEQGRF